jgi:hypothetical protein
LKEGAVLCKVGAGAKAGCQDEEGKQKFRDDSHMLFSPLEGNKKGYYE